MSVECGRPDQSSQPNHSKENEITNKICDYLDDIMLKAETTVNAWIRDARGVNSQYADRLEKELENLKLNGRYGTGLSAYIKSFHLRPLQDDLNSKSS